MDPRYVENLRTYGYLEISDQALKEFRDVIQGIRKIDWKKRVALVAKVQQKMDGLMTVEPQPVQRHYKTVPGVIKKCKGRSVVYFSPEMKLIGGPRSIFAGGLGVLAGEYVEGSRRLRYYYVWNYIVVQQIYCTACIALQHIYY